MRLGRADAGGAPVPQVAIGVNDSSNSNTAGTGADGTVNANINIKTRTEGNLFGIDSAKLTVGEGLKLEQVEELDQLKRYMDHLNQLRRLNEGDDTTDAPGYSLNLIRIPVSILPGTNSREGCGAEITVTASSVYGPELLPTSFRDFVLNDLTDQLAVPLTRFLNDNPEENRRL